MRIFSFSTLPMVALGLGLGLGLSGAACAQTLHGAVSTTDTVPGECDYIGQWGGVRAEWDGPAAQCDGVRSE